MARGSPLVESLGRGVYRVSDGARWTTVYVAADRDRLWVFVEGLVYELEPDGGPATKLGPGPSTRLGPGRRAGSHHESLTAPMPATVARIAVAPGQAVRKGETLIVLEAMKMELAIRAPHDGTVEAVHCREGELVQPDVPLLEIE